MSKSSQIFITKNKQEAGKIASEIIKSSLKKNPSSVLGISSGKTMLPLYKKLAELYKKNRITFKKTKIFTIDEYLNIKRNNKNSLHAYFQKNFFSKVNLDKKNIFCLNAKAKNPEKECSNYEKKIKSLGWADIIILGLGVNCHIAFNEPGSSLKSKTRVVNLSKETQEYNAHHSTKVPKKALTIGISTILNSKKIILIATGKQKKHAVKKTLYEKTSKKYPSTSLKKHKDVVFIFDKEAFA